MAIPLEGRLHWRRKAPFHVQLELQQPQEVHRVPDDIQIQGRAIRIFRTDGRVALGDHIAFTIWVCRPGDEPTGPAYIYFNDFMAARFMEAYLYGEPPKCRLAAYEFGVIGGPSEEPTLTARQLEASLEQLNNRRSAPQSLREPTKWFQFWKR